MSRIRMLALVVLASCSVLPKPGAASYQYVVLSSADVPADAAPAAAPINAALAVTLPTYLDRTDVVVRVSDNRLEFSLHERWAEALAVAVPRVAARDLAAAGVHVTEPGDAAVAVELSLDRFERRQDGRSELRAHWTMRRDRAVTAGDLRADDPLPVGASADEAAASLSRLLVKLTAAVAASLK
jgi:uncharacterized lipoprotein YmbA